MSDKYEIAQFADACWQDIFEKVNGAAVYIDHAATECLHWYQGDRAYLSLINAGAHSVHEMAMYNFQYVKVQGTKKAVIIITSIDPAFYQRTLNLIIQKNTFDSCTVVCGIHNTVLQYSSILSNEDEDSYEKLRNNILNWMNCDKNELERGDCSSHLQQPFVEVIFRPIFIAPITTNVFVAPPLEKLMPPLDELITDDNELNINHFVSSLHSLFTHFNVKEDIYTLGKFSEHVGEKLENLSAAVDRRKRLIGKSGVTLILIDRTLDLCTATKNNTECILSRILCTLPHLPNHNNDVAVSMTPLCSDLQDSPLSMTVPGCLATDDTSKIKLLIANKQKDVLLTLNKWLFEMSPREIQSPKTRVSTRVTAHSLEKLVHKIRDSETIDSLAKFSKQLQIIIAVIQTLKSEKTAQLDLLVSLEKLILQNMAVSRDSTSVLSQISNIIKMRRARGIDMENLFVLLIHIYSLAGDDIHFSAHQENQLRSALTDAIFEDIQEFNENVPTSEVSVYQQTLLLLGVTEEVAARESAERVTNEVMQVLHAVSKQRKNLKDYGSTITRTCPQEMAQCYSLIERLFNDLFHPTKPEIKDLQRKNASIISAGFSLLTKGRATHHPTDNSWIIIYVLGGITAEEAKIVEEISSQRNDIPQITLGGCRLLNPMNVADTILLSNVNMSKL